MHWLDTMTDMSTPAALPIDSRHVQLQFGRRQDLSAAEFLHGEIAQRMMQRLRLIRLVPETLLDAGCGDGRRVTLLKERYPEAAYIGQDFSAGLLSAAKRRFPEGWKKWVRQLKGRPPERRWIEADLASSGLAPESIELVWSNLALHWHPRPHDVIREWSRVLKPGGVVFFSCFGPSTLQEIRAAIACAQIQTSTPGFVDMHDFGDLRVEKGFGDPVMDQEIITLTYQTADKLLQDLRALGGNPALGRRAGLCSRAWRQRLMDALESQRHEDGTIHVSIEVAYGHAWKTAIQRLPGETRISLSAIQKKTR